MKGSKEDYVADNRELSFERRERDLHLPLVAEVLVAMTLEGAVA